MASKQSGLKRDSSNNPHPENGLATFIAILAVAALLFMAFSVF